MTVPQLIDGMDPRRSFARLELGIDAHLDTLGGRQPVRLIDLSQAGAHLLLNRPDAVREGVLTWLRFDTYGVVAWQEDGHLGLEFDQLLPLPVMVETRHRAPHVVREAAEAWVSGGLFGD